MIRLWGSTDRTFDTNGDMVIKPVRAKVIKEDNGKFYLDIETDLSYVDALTDGRIITANTPQGDQAFRIQNSEKTQSKIKIKANHVFYDTANYLILDSNVVEKSCNDALDHLNSATTPASVFNTISDVNTINSYRCVRTSLSEAVQVVLERWGGHLYRDNFTYGIKATIGQDNGVTVRYRKNLKEITRTTNWDAVATKLLPTGKDGIMLDALDSGADKYVYSETQYTIPYVKTVAFSQDINKDDYAEEENPDEAYMQALVNDLRQQAQEYVDTNCIPQVNYTLRANVAKVTDVGDTIAVIDERLGINLLTNVISYEYDCLLEKYTQLEFGNFKQTLGKLVSNINASTEKLVADETETVRVTLSQELHDATAEIMNVMGNSYVIYDGSQILVLDALPKEDATNVMRINAGGIGFSNTGINGTFTSAWTISGTMDMQNINVINLTADLIKGGTLKLGSLSNQSGTLELYDEQNALIGLMNKEGLTMYGADGSYVKMNNQVGFAGYDRNHNKIYWVDADEFHQKKSVVEEEITLCDKVRFIPITITDNGTTVNDGVGVVSVATS